MRRAVTTSSSRAQYLRRAAAQRTRLYSQRDIGPNRTHLNDKPAADSKLNPHSAQAAKAHEERTNGEDHSQAISQKDHFKSNQRIKDEHPAAPEPVIGMNSERGKKGY